MSPSRVGLGSKKLCVAHGGGPRCTRLDAHVVFDMPPPAYYTLDAVRLCWGCYVALHPDKAKVKVLKEHFVLAELQRRLQDCLAGAKLLEWDCRVPGGCSLRRPDLLAVFDNFYLQLEIDEYGHATKVCEDEDSRLAIIAADVDLPGVVARLNADVPGHECFRRKQLSKGEMGLEAVARRFVVLMDRAEEATRRMLAAPPETLRRVFLDAHPDRHEPLFERVW